MPVFLCVLALCMFIINNCLIAFGLRWAMKMAQGSDNAEAYRGLRKIISTTRLPVWAGLLYMGAWIAASAPLSAEIGPEAYTVGVVLIFASFIVLLVTAIQANALLRENLAKTV